ncbi:diacylglycerol kinase [Tabrizicola piscis]|jgi:diacylglycerol kinase (ATP)|uniref:Diacylglycerol kinase n=1 Tax=Tabrizicola piscis TaxID=2494374 RepID=A0A3S8U8G9_9RHOB|nr:diacylglycerol kinase [Tabrizicola piscis]AZL59820.1 diacylglycerol kinase [Tabrizicola piscis]
MSGTRPPRKTGLAHFVAAAGYSIGGARRLWRESAFRQEVLALGALVVIFAVTGATMAEFLGLLILSLIVLAVEALNTAIEELVDNASPGWSEFAKNTKDLGSFAVMCALVATGLYALWVVVL